MSKILCDMCGTAYPETADVCPICGCSKGENPQRVEDDTPQTKAESVRVPVKGGRYSKTNVKKRNRAVAAEAKASGAPVEKPTGGKDSSNKGLVILAIVLVLAILAVLAFIYVRYFMPEGGFGGQQQGTDTTAGVVEPEDTVQTDPQNTVTERIPCQQLTVSDAIVELEGEGDAYLLNVVASPADTTDVITYASSDDAIVMVSNRGKLTAVAPGQAVITITCGDQQFKCRVVCSFELPTDPTDPEQGDTPTDPVDTDATVTLNREDITMSSVGETWSLYSGSAPKALVTFTSDNPNVAKFENGTVIAVGAGVTKVHAEYEGKKVSCTVRCRNMPEVGGSETASGQCEIYINGSKAAFPVEGQANTVGVTIAVGESFKIKLVDKDGNKANVTWTSADSTLCSVSGENVVRYAKGRVVLTATFEGVTYKCIVN